ncbi:hypothetical protein PCANC_00351 [Puccinia coronata f. sp. avenae]|uniref:Uncharacterized protein n=1 Tax=Puccinia coronata f. sp. avenae TaxID=200324 RepID=A0A2N5W9E0_9BASI|nr:hypothetical protein PCANC_00351 [Puccinia coronata f. sp. avenae]
MWGRFKSANLLVSSAAPSSTVHHLVGLSVNCSGASWYQSRLVMLPPPGSRSIKATGFVVLSLLIRFHQHFFRAHQQNSLLKFSSSLFHIIMLCAPSFTRCASVVANPRLASPYPLRSRRQTLANPPAIGQPTFAGSRGQPIVVDNPAPVAPGKLPVVFDFQAPPGLGPFRPMTPCPGLDSPVYRPETPCPPNLDSPVSSSDEENPFVNQLASPVHQPARFPCPFLNGDKHLLASLQPFVVHCAMIGDGWANAPSFHHPMPPHPDSPDVGAPFGFAPAAPEFNLPPIPPADPTVDTYPFTDFAPVPTPEPRGFFDPSVFHMLNKQQIKDLLKRHHEPARFDRYAFGPQHFTSFYESISSHYVCLCQLVYFLSAAFAFLLTNSLSVLSLARVQMLSTVLA